MTNNNQFCKFSAIAVILLSYFHICNGFYEDQVGKFDWRQNYIGKINYGFFDVTGPDKIIVTTEENTIASINAKSGALNWRRILENSDRGEIKFCYIPNDPRSVASTTHPDKVIDIITISGHNPALVRGWNTNTGNLEWEWSLMPINADRAVNALWFMSDSYLYHIIPIWNSHIEVTEYIATTGTQRVTKTSKITADWISDDKCILSQNYFVCTNGDKLTSIDLLSQNANIVNRVFQGEVLAKPTLVKGVNGLINIGSRIISLKDEKLSSTVKENSPVFVYKSLGEHQNVIFQSYVEQGQLYMTATLLGSDENLKDVSTVTPYAESLGNPTIVDVRCRSDPRITCRILLSSEDGAIILLQQGKIKWVKEEALARVVAVEFIDLTLSDAEGAIEEELNNKNGDVFGAMVRRFTSQYSQLKNLVLHVLGLGAPPSATQRAGLVRDDFGLHKMIVVVTASGKMFGIDNVSGKLHWVRYLPNLEGFGESGNINLLIQRTSKYYPLPAQCAVVGKNKKTGNGIIYQFSPISGQPLSGGLIELDYQLQQMVLLFNTGSDHLRGILTLDSNNNVQVTPKASASFANGLHLYTAEKDTGSLTGYFVEYENNILKALPTWKVNLGGPSNTQKIVALAVKNPIEHVHSQGRVLADRSVLYKYINPNLIAVATHGPDTIHKYILNIHLIDVVSGAIVFSMTHRRVKPPLHMVHSENWLVYSYYNEKVRRTEITSVELYEGKTQANSTVWSSLEAPPQPLVEKQSYIIPANVAALKETITEKGITNKHVLIGLTSGNIVEMSWAFLDPRRPVTSPEKAREEGIIPYIPELPLPHENVINYNQSVARISGIHTSPSGLESTCLVFIYGLDIFVTRVAPSKTFDLLKEDFDYFLISVVLIALTTASYVVKQLSSRKALKQAWK